MSVKTLEGKVDRILVIMNGNGDIGLCAKVELHDDFIRKEKRGRRSILNFIFRAVIFIMVSYIAVRVGLK